MHITTLGIDMAKHVLQLHGVDARGRAGLSRRVTRDQLVHTVASLPPCVSGREAGGSAQHWGRACEPLGHTVKLMHPKYVRPSVKTNKNDRRDAEAIGEAVSRPTMRGVSIKTVEQVDLQAVHRTRSLFVKHRTAVITQIRGVLAESGLVIGQSPEKVRPALVRFLDDAALGLTACARDTFAELCAPLTELDARIERVTHRVERVSRAHPVCQKLAAVPGIGSLTATALVATVGRPQAFHNGRHLAAWLGLVPRQYSSGGKERVGGISKRGSRSVRTRLIHEARAVVQRAERRTDTQGRWLCALTHRTSTHVATVAVANSNARVIWALLAHDEMYRPPASVQDGSPRASGGEEQRAASHQEDSHDGVQRGRSVMTPEGQPARSDPGHMVGPTKAVVLMRSTRAYFIKARTHLWSTERPDRETQPCFSMVHRVTGRRCSEGWVHI